MARRCTTGRTGIASSPREGSAVALPRRVPRDKVRARRSGRTGLAGVVTAEMSQPHCRLDGEPASRLFQGWNVALECALSTTRPERTTVIGAADAARAQRMKGISIVVDRLYCGYESGKRSAMKRSSTVAL